MKQRRYTLSNQIPFRRSKLLHTWTFLSWMLPLTIGLKLHAYLKNAIGHIQIIILKTQTDEDHFRTHLNSSHYQGQIGKCEQYFCGKFYVNVHSEQLS